MSASSDVIRLVLIHLPEESLLTLVDASAVSQSILLLIVKYVLHP